MFGSHEAIPKMTQQHPFFLQTAVSPWGDWLRALQFRQSGIVMEIPPNVPTAASGAERRDWDRLPISIPFFMRGSKTTGEEFLEFSTALNISAGGALLATTWYLEASTHITLEVPIALANKAQLPRSVSLLQA